MALRRAPIVNKLIEAVTKSAQPPLFAVQRHPDDCAKRSSTLQDELWRRHSIRQQKRSSTIGAKDALAHLLFAVIGPGDAVVSPNPAYPIHQYGVMMAEGHACMLPMPNPDTFLNRLEDLYRRQ